MFSIAGLLFWCGHAAIVWALAERQRRASTRTVGPAIVVQPWLAYYAPRIWMTVLLAMFFLYPQVGGRGVAPAPGCKMVHRPALRASLLPTLCIQPLHY